MKLTLRKIRCGFLMCLLLLAPAMAHAHVGSPDVVVQAQAGPYAVLVSVEPPSVVPGVAQIQVQSNASDITSVSVAPMPLTGAAAAHPPVADELTRVAGGGTFYSGNAWLMANGSWQMRVTVTGTRGSGTISVPVPSVATSTLPMPSWLKLLLGILGAALLLGMAGMVGAAQREALLPPGAPPDAAHIRKARISIVIAALVVVTVTLLGGWWWSVIATAYRANLYKPLKMDVALTNGNQLKLNISDPNTSGAAWLAQRGLDDLLLDHGHVMHLFMLREPQFDVLLHLHPVQTGAGEFVQALPPMPSGEYLLYADIVHANGFAETVTGEVGVPLIQNAPRVSGDDAIGLATPLNDADWLATSEPLPDNYTMVFDRPQNVQRGTPVLLRFELLDAKGKPPADMSQYMGMGGHAAVIKADGSVFAHIHPFGSAAMAAMMLANPNSQQMHAMSSMGTGIKTDSTKTDIPSNVVVFPYAFPVAGSYRMVVEMKHGDVVETGAFDVAVD